MQNTEKNFISFQLAGAIEYYLAARLRGVQREPSIHPQYNQEKDAVWDNEYGFAQDVQPVHEENSEGVNEMCQLSHEPEENQYPDTAETLPSTENEEEATQEDVENQDEQTGLTEEETVDTIPVEENAAERQQKPEMNIQDLFGENGQEQQNGGDDGYTLPDLETDTLPNIDGFGEEMSGDARDAGMELHPAEEEPSEPEANNLDTVLPDFAAMGNEFAETCQDDNKPAEQKKICPDCGQEIAAGGKFCTNCGARVKNDAEVQTKPTENDTEVQTKPTAEIPTKPEPVIKQVDQANSAEEVRMSFDGFTGVGTASAEEEIEEISDDQLMEIAGGISSEQVMENTETLHAVDKQNAADQQEFSSLLSFMKKKGLSV